MSKRKQKDRSVEYVIKRGQRNSRVFWWIQVIGVLLVIIAFFFFKC